MVTERLEKLNKWARHNALTCIFPFWTSDLIVDRENGGFVGRVTLDMQIDNSEPRGLTLAGRMLYAFSTAYRVFNEPLFLEKARYAFDDLVKRFYDREYGGAYISVAASGEVLDDSKPNYCEAFLLMGCAAYYRASGDKEALRIAEETFDLMETRVKTGPGRYRNNMTRDWQPREGLGFGKMKGPAFPDGAVMFPHHLCQGYVQLFEAAGDERVKKALYEMGVFIADTLYDEKYRCLKTIVDKDGARLGTRQSFGHDCEISYLAMKLAKLVGDAELTEKLRRVMTDVLTNARDNDFDAYGGLINGGDLASGERERSHIWWAQAEGVTAMLCGYELTGDAAFLTAAERQVDFIDKYFVNREHGDWYNNVLVDEDGGHIVDGMHGLDKLNGGKCPFHNSQMCFEVIERTERLMEQMDKEKTA